MTVPHHPSPAAAKVELRRRLRSARAARPADLQELAARQLAGWALAEFAGGVVAGYASYGSEPGTTSLRAALRATGTTVLLPVIRGEVLAWVVDDGADHPRRGERNMPEPAGDIVGVGGAGLLALNCQVVLLPALAVTATGIRLGQGGGFYDRLLADLPRHPPGPLRVAVVHQDEFLLPGEIPYEPHDQLGGVDMVLTPQGVHLVTASSAGD